MELCSTNLTKFWPCHMPFAYSCFHFQLVFRCGHSALVLQHVTKKFLPNFKLELKIFCMHCEAALLVQLKQMLSGSTIWKEQITYYHTYLLPYNCAGKKKKHLWKCYQTRNIWRISIFSEPSLSELVCNIMGPLSGLSRAVQLGEVLALKHVSGRKWGWEELKENPWKCWEGQIRESLKGKNNREYFIVYVKPIMNVKRTFIKITESWTFQHRLQHWTFEKQSWILYFWYSSMGMQTHTTS